MAFPASLPALLNPPLTPREAVIDALYRCVNAFDTNDPTLFDTTFTPDGIMDVNGKAITGRAEIHKTGLALIFSLDTTHFVSSVRVHLKDENEASLTATVLSQHFALGKGMELGQNNLLGGSLYRGELVRDGDGLWKFKYLLLKSTWLQGDYGIVGGGEFSEQEKINA